MGARAKRRGMEEVSAPEFSEGQGRPARRSPDMGGEPGGEREGRLQKTDAAGDAGFEGDEPLARERAQVLIDALAIAQPHRAGQIGAGRRPSVTAQELLDQFQHLTLAWAGLGARGIHDGYHTIVWYRLKAGRFSVLGLQPRFLRKNNA